MLKAKEMFQAKLLRSVKEIGVSMVAHCHHVNVYIKSISNCTYQ